MPQSPPPDTVAPPVPLLQLTLIFARIGCLAWGGGGATLAMMHDAFCGPGRWVSEEEFGLLFGLSRVLPGMNLLSLTVLLGYRSHGLAGSVMALVGLTVPSFALIVLGCVLLRGGHPSPYLMGAVRGLGPAAAALLLYTGWQLCEASFRKLDLRSRLLWMAVLAAVAVLTVTTSIHSAWLVLGGALLGVCLARWVVEARA
jgi:chromate transporter